MKTFLKIFSGLLLLLIIGVAVFVYTFEANDYKQELAGVMEMITGKPVNIAGDITVSLYPKVELNINEVTIANPDGFSGETFARVGHFNIKMETLPLLQKYANIESLQLNDLDMNFEKNAAGGRNWKSSAGLSDTDDVESVLGLSGLKVESMNIKDANISWLDVTSGKQLTVSKMNLSTEAVKKNRPLPVTFKAYIKSDQPQWQGAVLARTNLEFKEGSPVFNANDLRLAVKALLQDSDLETITFKLFADSTINVQEETVRLSGARFNALGLLVSGDVVIDDIFSLPVIQGPVNVAPFDMNELASRVKSTLPIKAVNRDLDKITLKTLLKTDFDSIYLHDMVATVDQSRVEGFIHIKSISQPDINYDLEINSINISDYGLVSDDAKSEEVSLPLDFIRTSMVNGTVKVDTARIDETILNKISIKSSIQEGVLNISPVTMLVGESKVEASIALDATETPTGVFSVQANDVSAKAAINPLLEMIMGEKAIQLRGKVNAMTRLEAKGSDLASLKRSANGLLKINMDNPVVKGIDLDYTSRYVAAEYANRNNFRTRKAFVPKYQPDRETEFDNLSATFRVTGSKLVNNDLLLVSDGASITGSGSIDFDRGRLDYRPVIDMKVNNTVDIRDRLRDHPVEYHTYGNFGHLSHKLNAEKYDLLVGRLLYQEAKERRIRQKKSSTWENFKSR